MEFQYMKQILLEKLEKMKASKELKKKNAPEKIEKEEDDEVDEEEINHVQNSSYQVGKLDDGDEVVVSQRVEVQSQEVEVQDIARDME